MKRIRSILCLTCVLISVPQLALAFSFHGASGGTLAGKIGNFNTFASSGTVCTNWSTTGYVNADGQSGSPAYDGVYVQTYTVSSSLVTSFATDGITVNISPGAGSRIWTSTTDWVSNKSSTVMIQLCRPANKSFTTINGGTVNVKVIQTNVNKSYWVGGTGNYSYIPFTLPKIEGISKTCDVKGVNNSTVELPPVPRSALAVGTGRYTEVLKDFTYTLECTNKPKVNLKFSSANQMIVGTDNVLSNTTPGNPDVGFQVYYNNAALKFGDNKALMTSTQKDEQLKFTAYYYRKSTNVNSGVITSNAEFTFTYE